MKQGNTFLKVVSILLIVFTAIALVISILGILSISMMSNDSAFQSGYADLLNGYGLTPTAVILTMIFSILVAGVRLAGGIMGVRFWKTPAKGKLLVSWGIVMIVVSVVCDIILGIYIRTGIGLSTVFAQILPILYIIAANALSKMPRTPAGFQGGIGYDQTPYAPQNEWNNTKSSAPNGWNDSAANGQAGAPHAWNGAPAPAQNLRDGASNGQNDAQNIWNVPQNGQEGARNIWDVTPQSAPYTGNDASQNAQNMYNTQNVPNGAQPAPDNVPPAATPVETKPETDEEQPPSERKA